MLVLQEVTHACVRFFGVVSLYFLNLDENPSELRDRIRRSYSLISKIPDRIEYLNRVLRFDDQECINHLRMNRQSFARLCFLVETSGGLKTGRNSSVAEQVAMFLSIIAHHTKYRIVKGSFKWSSRTVSRHFHRVLNAIIRLHPMLLAQPEPVDDDCTDARWNCFQVHCILKFSILVFFYFF